MNDSTSATSPVWPTRWPKDSFTGFWTWLVAGFIALLFIGLFVFSQTSKPPTNVDPLEFDLLIAFQFVLEGILVAIVIAAMPALSKFSLRELGFRVPTWSNLGIALLGALAMVVVANGGATLIDRLAHSQHQQDIIQIFKGLHDTTTIEIFVAFAVIFAPFAEETFFRLLFFNLGLRYGGFWAGAILSGVLFGIAHGDIFAAVPLALGGIVLCAVYYRTGNIFASMISHALFNTRVDRRAVTNAESRLNPKGGIVVMLASLVLAAALPATAAPLGELHYLVGTWNCTYRAASRYASPTMPPTLTIATATRCGRPPPGRVAATRSCSRMTRSAAAGRSVVFDDRGTATILRATGSNPNHIAYRSVYPDASIAVTFDRISATEYTLHGTVRSGGKTITSVDTCVASSDTASITGSAPIVTVSR